MLTAACAWGAVPVKSTVSVSPSTRSANRGTGGALGVIDEIVTARIENLETVFFDNRLDLLLAAAASGNLSLDVAHPFLWRTNVGFEHLQQCVVTHAALV